MKRTFHLRLVLLAATTHLLAPVVVHAVPMAPASPGDLCSVARGVSAPSPGPRAPRPAVEHHCPNAPCCTSGALHASAPPSRGLAAVYKARHPVRALPVRPDARPPIAIASAQPRGPPTLS